MCGIFGCIASQKIKNKKNYKAALKKLFLLSESRGKEAAGIFVKKNNEINFIKEAIPASELIKNNFYKNTINTLLDSSSNILAIGHSRLVTNGHSIDNKNNQPLYTKNIIGVHNGIIANYEKLWGKRNIKEKKTDLDTEVLFQLISKNSQKNSIPKAIVNSYKEIEGVANIAFVHDEYNEAFLATNNGSLYYIFSDDQNSFLFASEKYILKKTIEDSGLKKIFSLQNISQLKPNHILSINLANLTKTIFSFSSKVISGHPNYKKKTEVSEIVFPKNYPKYISINKKNKIDKSLIDRAYKKNSKIIKMLKRCTKCILPETMPFISFDKNGVCNYCKNYIPHQIKGEKSLQKIFKYKENKSYDCLVTLSGGRDSSYGLHFMKKKMNLDVSAYTYDWGMVTDLARRNQMRMCGSLNTEHILVSADILKKRNNIKKNILAWLKKPDLGMIPLFMAGDKQFFYWSHVIAKQLNTDIIISSENLLEKTNFKTGFCGIPPINNKKNTYGLTFFNKFKLVIYYLKNFIKNPSYLNSSILDTFFAFSSYYIMKHKFINIFDYIRWDEQNINTTLINEYNWEKSSDTNTTWRIGDGTAAFYNYIYYTIAGLTENDTFRSNQIREGSLTRKKALKMSIEENKPRTESIIWYLNTIGIDFNSTIKKINNAPKKY